MKAGTLVRYNSRLLLVLGKTAVIKRRSSKKASTLNTDGWYRCIECGTNTIRVYHPGQLTIIKTEKEFYL